MHLVQNQILEGRARSIRPSIQPKFGIFLRQDNQTKYLYDKPNHDIHNNTCLIILTL